MKESSFPAIMPPNKPADRKLSAAMERMYDKWNPYEDRRNEFFSNFKYSHISGIGKEDDGFSRRDPSKVIKYNDTYYVWYTSRRSLHEPAGPEACTDDVPAYDWDLADIYYATSKDGFNWIEQGVAVSRAAKGQYADRSIATPDILMSKGKFYLYYQAYTGMYGHLTKHKAPRPGDKVHGESGPEIYAVQGDFCNVSMAWADCPDGPWHPLGRPVLDVGDEDDWDSGAVHDPYPLKYQGKYWLYYKSVPLKKTNSSIIRAQGVAIAVSPDGPFVKSELNPVLNSGHETFLYPFREGIAAVATFDGPEKNTVQYASDGLNFEVKSIVQIPPTAAGPFCEDAFADHGDGRGISWGLCHIPRTGSPGKFYIARFDCDLHRDIDRSMWKDNRVRVNEQTYFQKNWMLTDRQKTQFMEEATERDNNTKL
jgi:hypothetical protein